MVLLPNIAFPIWGVGAAPRGCFPPADGEGAALPPGRQELNPEPAGPDRTRTPGQGEPGTGGEESGELRLRDAGASLPPTPAAQCPLRSLQ